MMEVLTRLIMSWQNIQMYSNGLRQEYFRVDTTKVQHFYEISMKFLHSPSLSNQDYNATQTKTSDNFEYYVHFE